MIPRFTLGTRFRPRVQLSQPTSRYNQRRQVTTPPVLLYGVVVLLFLGLFFLIAQAGTYPQERQITVVFRYDDYSNRTSTHLEVKLIDAFQKFKVRSTFGVIPYGCAPDVYAPSPQDVALSALKADILRKAIKAGILEVALHGYCHQRVREGADGGYSEFVGMDSDTQLKRIRKGKRYLEEVLGTDVSTFIPPWHSYDLNTLQAVATLNFKSISASWYGPATASSLLKFLPAIVGLINLRDAVESARRIADVQPVIVVLFHEYDFAEINQEKGRFTYEEFDELVSWIASQEDVIVRTIADTIDASDDLGATHFMNNKAVLFYRTHPLVPPFLWSSFSRATPKVYLSSAVAGQTKFKLDMILGGFYLAVLAISMMVGFVGGYVAFPRFSPVITICKYGGPVVVVAVALYAYRDFEVYYKGAALTVALLGVCIGIWSFVAYRCRGAN